VKLHLLYLQTFERKKQRNKERDKEWKNEIKTETNKEWLNEINIVLNQYFLSVSFQKMIFFLESISWDLNNTFDVEWINGN